MFCTKMFVFFKFKEQYVFNLTLITTDFVRLQCILYLYIDQ